eukprot:gene14790-biopygen8129
MLLVGQPGGAPANQMGCQLWVVAGRVVSFAQGLVSAVAAPAALQFIPQPPFLVTVAPAEPSHWNQTGPVRPGDLAAHRPMDYGEP